MINSLGYTYSQIKTVEKGHYKEYDITNSFYMSRATKNWNALRHYGMNGIFAFMLFIMTLLLALVDVKE